MKKILFFLVLATTVFLAHVKHVNSEVNYSCIVEKVIDGDTIICSGKKIRLIGIDAPETSINPHIEKQRRLGDTAQIISMGKEAKAFVKKLMPTGTKVRLEYDVERFDRYGRTLAYVWLPDNRMANEVILREGYAMLLTIPPNVKYAERFRKAYREAVENKRGLWRFKN
ncbi:MAG: thermonuclease family protein [candidate division WOR-3 bacterium]